MEHRTKHTITNDTYNMDKCLILLSQPSTEDGNDNTIKLIKTHPYLKQYRQADVVNIVSNIGPNLDFFETLDASIFSEVKRSANRQEIQDLLEQNEYDKIFVSTGQHFLTNYIKVHRNIYIKEFNAIIQLFEPYQDKVYCFGTTRKKMIGKSFFLAYCVCNRNTNKYLTDEPIKWNFTN